MEMELCSVHILSFHTLNEHILLMKRASDESQYLVNSVIRVYMNTLNAKVLNLRPSHTILIGFLTILISGEKYTPCHFKIMHDPQKQPKSPF